MIISCLRISITYGIIFAASELWKAMRHRSCDRFDLVVQLRIGDSKHGRSQGVQCVSSTAVIFVGSKGVDLGMSWYQYGSGGHGVSVKHVSWDIKFVNRNWASKRQLWGMTALLPLVLKSSVPVGFFGSWFWFYLWESQHCSYRSCVSVLNGAKGQFIPGVWSVGCFTFVC